MPRPLVLFAIVLLMSFTSFTSFTPLTLLSPAHAADAGTRSILIAGDSLSAAHGIAVERGWPVLLEQRLHTGNHPYRVINISVSGETTQGGLTRLAPALRQHRPAIVVIELGANDGLRGLPLERMRDNLLDMIRQSRAIQARVLLIGMKVPPNYGADYARKFHEVYVDVAHKTGVPLVPFLFEGFAEDRAAFIDGLHPTAATQPRLLDNIWPGLQPLLRKP